MNTNTVTCNGENNTSHNIGIKIDTYGNLYFDTSMIDNKYFTNGQQYTLHQICIDRDNNLAVESHEYEEILVDSKIDLQDISLLQTHIIDEFEYLNKLGEGYVDENNEYFVEEENDDSNGNIIDEDITNQYGFDNYEFIFSSSNNTQIEVVQIKDECLSSLYDVIIYNQDKLVFCSSARHNDSIYKITIRNNTIYLRPVGYPETMYNIFIEKSGLIKINKVVEEKN